MKHPSHVAECPICRQNDPDDNGWPIDVLYEDSLWLVHHCHNAKQPPDADGTALEGELTAEAAEVLGVLGNDELLGALTGVGTVAGTTLAHDAHLNGTLGHF